MVTLQNEEAFRYNNEILPKLIDLSLPVLSLINIRSFRYFNFLEDGKYLVLSTDNDWLKKRLEIPDNGHAFHPALRHTPLNASYFYLWNPDLSDPITRLYYDFNIWNGFSIYRRFENSVEVWSFGASREDTGMPQFYINNTDKLNDFIKYFSVKASDLLNISDTRKLATFSEDVDISFSDEISKESSLESFKNHLENNNNKKCFFIFETQNIVCLSKREDECMQYFSQGKTAKEVALALNLSPRTVESYLEHIKVKMGFRFKSKVIETYVKAK